jgi:hypothetical protein
MGAHRHPRSLDRRLLGLLRPVLLLAASLVLLLGAGAPPRPAPGAGVPQAPDAKAASPGAGTSHRPPKLRPLPAVLERRMAELVRTAERYRGLRLERRVPWGRISEAELRGEVVADLAEELPPERLAAVELSLKAFGLIPEGMDLRTYYPGLLTSQIAGFYDPHRKVLAVIDRPGGLLGRKVTPQLGSELTRKMEDGLLVHELTHAIQDQHFNLDRLADPDPLSDGGVARLALVEGDATLVMFDDLVHEPLEDLPEAQKLLGLMLPEEADDEGAAEAGAGAGAGLALPGEKEMATAPAWFRDQLLFSYSRGAAFCLEVRRRGGQRLLDYAFAVDPPRSSEQILHPEKWYGHRDDPVAIVWPDLGRELPGWVKAAEGQLGEEGIGILLRTALGGGEAAPSAAGWGGDRFAVYKRGGSRLLAWIADWDTDAAAASFQAAAARLGAGWTVARAAPRRVTVLRGELAEAERTAAQAALAGARAERPANHDVDLARIEGRATPAGSAGAGQGMTPPRGAAERPQRRSLAIRRSSAVRCSCWRGSSERSSARQSAGRVGSPSASRYCPSPRSSPSRSACSAAPLPNRVAAPSTALAKAPQAPEPLAGSPPCRSMWCQSASAASRCDRCKECRSELPAAPSVFSIACR